MTTANPLASGSHQPVAIVEIIDKIELIAKESLLWGGATMVLHVSCSMVHMARKEQEVARK